MKNKNVITQATDWDAIEFSLDYNVLPFNKKWSNIATLYIYNFQMMKEPEITRV